MIATGMSKLVWRKNRLEDRLDLALDATMPLFHGVEPLIEPLDRGSKFNQDGIEARVKSFFQLLNHPFDIPLV
ncbi:MAG TPA: hypothetical protein VI756_29335 [Blastocatellia bacterium]